jgi:hypothetical protein
MIRSIIYIFTLIILVSCSNPKNETYNELYLVTELNLKNDSVVKSKSSQFHSHVEVKGSNQIWNKKFFTKTYETLNKPTYNYYDSILFRLDFNKKGELTRINNWNQILLKVKEQVLEMTNGEPVTDPVLKDFINNVCLDSNLIVNKNIKEIMLFNIGYSFILDSIKFKKNNPEYKVFYNKNDIILRVKDIDVTQLSQEIINPIQSTLNLEGCITKAIREVQIIISNNQITSAFLKTKIWQGNNGPYSNELYLTIE